MKFDDIRILAQVQMSMAISKPVAMKYGNESMSILAEAFSSACIIDSAEITLAANEWIALPKELLTLLEVTYNNYNYNAYEVSNGSIRSEHSGNFTLRYLRYPNTMITDTETPEIHQGYHKIIAYYIASRYINSKFGADNEESKRYMSEFYTKARVLDERLKNQRKSRRIKIPQSFM